MPEAETSRIYTGSSNVETTSDRQVKLDGGRLLASAALIGAGVVYGLPLIGQLLRPVITTTVQPGYSAAASLGDLLAGARDEVQDIVANARSDHQRSPSWLITPRIR
jgi:hypothetical protein